MTRTLIPTSAHIICRHGSHVLLIQNTAKNDPWPNFWGFPGGKLHENEFCREAALRETREEIGIIGNIADIQQETLLMHRSLQGTKIVYFGELHNYANAPEIREKNLLQDWRWWDINNLPEIMIPQHRAGLEAIIKQKHYTEIDLGSYLYQ